MPKAFPSVLTFLLALCVAARCRAEDALAALSPKLKPIPVCATLSTATAANHIPLAGIDASFTNRVLQPGDSMTVLGTVFVKKKESQWVLQQGIAEVHKDYQPAALRPEHVWFTDQI